MKKCKTVSLAEMVVLLGFVSCLLLCIVFNLPVLSALIAGYFLFGGYALYKKHSPKDVLLMSFKGVRTVKNILLTFVLIGMITAVWRSSGTIAYIVFYATKFFSPNTMLLATFLLCCLLSFLTGTAFGTAATMGVICASIAGAMGISPMLTGGAVLAGSFFGDRCSPMSTSALLVSSVTKTDLFSNIKAMLKSSVVPFALSCFIYFLLSVFAKTKQNTIDVCSIFEQNFNLSPLLLIPAVVILVLSLFRINVKITMSVSIVAAFILSLFVQKCSIAELLHTLVCGFMPTDKSLAVLMQGGGIFSMKNVFFIVCISSAYAGIFEKTGLLNALQRNLLTLSEKVTPYGSILLTSAITSMISCNQTLAILLTHQLCADTQPDKNKMALSLENSVVVMAPLVPWSIASGVPLSSVGAPALSILAAVYLYLLPLWNMAVVLAKRKKAKN